MDISQLISIAKEYNIDTIHPGYGFLSESAVFARRMWDEAAVVVIGPGWNILDTTADKLTSKELARSCNVPVLQAFGPTRDLIKIKDFANTVGYPLMIKALDGGGGRGIRLVQEESGLSEAVKRAAGESPSGEIFAERAAINGYRHIEVQIVGDGNGNIAHLWERECSIQRRFQKIVEFAPSSIKNRSIIEEVINSAIKMARKVNYLSLGTFEFLVSESSESREFYFLECNPRLQVEHTVTECISGVDLVRAQLLIAQGANLKEAGVPEDLNPADAPFLQSIQLRVTAEDVNNNFLLSIGRISGYHAPGGNGVRIDTHIRGSEPTLVGTDFDSLLAKVVVTAGAGLATNKAKRAISEMVINGVKTNLSLLSAILNSSDFEAGHCDTQWLERNLPRLLQASAATNQSQNIPRSTLTNVTTPAPAKPQAMAPKKGAGDDQKHILAPFAGTLIEVLVDPGDTISKDEPVIVLRQMKMELEIRASRGGVVKWVIEVEEGELIDEGTVIVEFEEKEKL
jgi:pyruvate carboxylase